MGEVLIEDAAGSRELAGPLGNRGIPVKLAPLGSIIGDVAFSGKGEGGSPVWVGVEYKKLGELVSSFRTERLQGFQAPRMAREYDFRYLLVEGSITADDQGLLQVVRRRGGSKPMPGRMTVSELYKRLYVLHLMYGLNLLTTLNQQQTLAALLALYRTWTDVALDEHKSHLAVYTPPSLVPLSQFRVTVQSLPGVGRAVSKAAQAQFKTLRGAINATAQQWAALTTTDRTGKTRKFGINHASKLVEELTHDYSVGSAAKTPHRS